MAILKDHNKTTFFQSMFGGDDTTNETIDTSEKISEDVSLCVLK